MLTNEKDADENVRLVQMHLEHQVRKYWFQVQDIFASPHPSLALNMEGLGVKCCGNW